MDGIFHGKKAMCFIALSHHMRMIFPITQALVARGMEVKYFVASAESAFEITLLDAGLPYVHALDYADAEVQAQLRQAYRDLRSSWQERVLSYPALQAVPFPIQDKNSWSALESYFCFKRMFEVEKPDVLFALHERNMWGKIIGHLSHELRIPYITFQEGYYFGSPPCYRFHTDYSTACVVWGEFKRNLLIRGGSSPDKTVPLGNIDLWQARAETLKRRSIETTRKELGIGSEKKLVLFLMCNANYATIEADRLTQWLKARGDIVAVFKWHPITGPQVIERAAQKLKTSPFVISTQSFDTYKLMGASDVCVIVGTSTSGMEALAYDKPLLEIRLPDRAFSFAEQGLAEPVQQFEHVAEKIEAILDRGVPPERLDRIEAYMKDLFAYRDDKTPQRIADMVGEMMRARKLGPLPLLSSPQPDSFPCSLILPVDDGPANQLLSTLQSINEHVPSELFEVIIVDRSSSQQIHDLLNQLEGDVAIIPGEPGWTFAECCNRAVVQARGRYLAFLKPGFVICPGWLEGLLDAAKDRGPNSVVGGRVLNPNGLLWHIGVAFDANQSPFSIYRMLPAEFAGAQGEREFKAVESPFLVARELFCRLGGFSTDLINRFEDIDFCLRAQQEGRRVLYTPSSTLLRVQPSWLPSPEQDRLNCYRFYARWTGSLWQDDDRYLEEDGLTHDKLSALYRDLASRVADHMKDAGIYANGVVAETV
jgi:GT2 family glycosyltransferase